MMTARHFATPLGVSRDWDSVQFKTIFAFCFAVYLPIAIAARLFPAYWRAGSRADTPHRSVFADAIAGAGTTAQLAFWG